jgi:hypothetical protein
VLGADVGVVQALGFLARQREHFFDPRRVRNVADHLGLGPAADLFFDLHADRFHVQAHLLQDVNGHPLAELDQAEQQVLGAQIIVIETVSFLAGQGQDLLSTGSKVVHHFRFLRTKVIALSKR